MSPVASTDLTFARVAAIYLSEAKYEFLRLLRTPAFSIPILGFPVAFYLFFAVLIAGGRGGPEAADMTFVGWTVYGVMGPGVFGFGILLALEREQHLLTFKRALPMPPAAYLTAKMLMSMMFAMVVMGLLTLAATFVAHITLPPERLLAVAGVMMLGILPACAIGLFIGAWAPGSSAPAIANIAYMAMAFLGGLFFPLPGALQAWAAVWPTYHVGQLAWAAAGRQIDGNPLIHLGVLVGVTTAFVALAARRLARSG